MKRTIRVGIVALSVIVGLFYLNIYAQKQSASQSKPEWEYKTAFTYQAQNIEHLNSLGAQGWELAGVVPGDSGYATLIFKRIK